MNKENQIRGGGSLNKPTSKTRRVFIANFIFSLLVVISSVVYVNVKLNPKQEGAKKKNLIAMYVQGEDGEYSLSSDTKFPTTGYTLNLEKSSCKNGGTLSQDPTTKALSVSASNRDECTVYFDKEVAPSADKILAHLNITSNGVRTSFDDPATTDEGVFEMEDDYGTSYYYRGAVENNYVQFAGFYWRIIRINGDGSLRIIFDGTSAHANGESNTDRVAHTGQAYNTNINDAKYVGWMYSPSGTTASTSKEEAQTNIESSSVKKVVDEWYKTNIVDKGYSSAVSDEIFCNDRSTPGKAITGWTGDTGLGYGSQQTAYGAFARLWNGRADYYNLQPTFKCPQKNDAFTVSDTEAGNGALTYPIGLITVDEIVAVGSGKYNTTNQKYYLYKGNWYWSLSPCTLSVGGSASVFRVNTTGYLNDGSVYSVGAVAPVINLSAEYAESMVGTGTMTDPYRVA